MDHLTLLVVALLVAGVLGTAAPRVPGPLLSIAGVSLHWWATDYAEPDPLTVVALTLAASLAILGSVLGPRIAARVGGVSTIAVTIGAGVGVVLFAFLGTTGLLAGILGTVSALEYLRRRDARESVLAGVAVVLASFGSKLMQGLVTGAILVAMIVVLFA